jgi:hypothetical protein
MRAFITGLTPTRRRALGCASRLTLVVLCLGADVPPRVTTPKQQFGFHLGDDYCLINYRQLSEYWHRVSRESDRVQVVRFGTTEEGRPQILAVVTSPANHRKLDRYRDIARRLCQAEGVSRDEARQLAAEGKAVVWIDGGLHASETLCAQMLTETLFHLASGDDAETRRFLDDTIVLLVHANPDGHDLVADWYMREPDPKKRSLSGVPRLYQKYAGHDNNRDFYANNLAETRNMNRVMYHEWFPQIVYNHHQSGPPGTVMFIPPFRDPFNYNVDPLVTSGIDAVGAAMMQRFLAEGKAGVTVRSGTRYSTWWNGGLRTACYFHNMIGLLSETIGNPTPMQIPLRTELQLPRGDYLAPIPTQPWHLRQSVDYSVTANKAVLDYASRHREQVLFNIWLMGHNAIERGRRDSWTITPKVVAQAKAQAPVGRGTPADFVRLFRDPARRDARGYVIPADQPDFLTATKFVNALINSGVTVHRATAAFEAAGRRYPAGSYVVTTAQAFRAHVVDLFEPQDHPNDFAYPGGPPTPPYDIAGWTLAYQMGVGFDRLVDALDGPFEVLRAEVSPPPAHVSDASGAAGFAFDGRVNDSYRAVNRLFAAGEQVVRTTQGGAGSFFVANRSATGSTLEKLAAELGVGFTGTQTPTSAVTVRPVRIALWDRYGGSMPSGWTRFVLERFEFPFRVVFPPELDAGGLRDKYDVLILPDGAVPGRGGPTERPPREPGGDTPPAERDDAPGDQSVPAEYRGRRGTITVNTTVPKLREFLEAGGTVIAIGTSTNLAQHLGLPVSNFLASKEADGTEKPLPREKFYVPGSVLRMRLDPAHPLCRGLGEQVDVMFTSSPTFRLGGDVRRVGWFEGKELLRSGWAWGQDHLDGGVAVAEAKVGTGRLVLFGPQVLFRAQPHGTFKLLFNAIQQAGSQP